MQKDNGLTEKGRRSSDIEAPSQAQASALQETYRNSAFRRLLSDVHETSPDFMPMYLRMACLMRHRRGRDS
jgi:hypothetical protein